MIPAPGLLLVKPIETAESFGGQRIVLLEETRQRWSGMQCEVVAVGAPESCEDEDCERPHPHPIGVSVGDWCVVKPRCYVPTDEEDRWVIKQSDVLAVLTVEGVSG